MWFVRMGSKVTGPHSEAQLKSLRQRGQFSPLHQISVDRIRWEPAAQLIQMIDATSIDQSQWKPKPVPSTKEPSPSPATSDKEWFYLDSSRKQQGPVSQVDACELAKLGIIRRQTLLCRIEGGEWQAATNLPFLHPCLKSSFLSMPVYLSAAGILIAAVLVTAWTFGAFDSRRVSQPIVIDYKPPAENPPLLESAVISQVQNNKVLAKSIGYVLATFYRANLDGTRGSKSALGHGTAFVITADGYLMTNKHVAEMGVNENAKSMIYSDYLKRGKELLEKKAQVAGTPEEQSVNVELKEVSDMLQIMGKAETDIGPQLKVYIDQVPFEAKIVHISDRFDMAILKIDRKGGPFFSLSLDNEPEQGIEVYTLGFPGIANDARSIEDVVANIVNSQLDRSPEESLQPQHLKFSRTNGTISRVVEGASRKWEIEHTVQTFPGNSGGPIFDEKGTVVGLHFAGKAGDSGGKLNLALSTGQFRKELDEYVKTPIEWRTNSTSLEGGEK